MVAVPYILCEPLSDDVVNNADENGTYSDDALGLERLYKDVK
jgi:hypothetical protein